jgi:hypothetical protein
MRRKCIIKDGNICLKKSETAIECPSRQQFMQGDKMPPCRVGCALLAYYRANDDYCEDRERTNMIYVLTCGDDRIGCLDPEDLDDSIRSNTNYEVEVDPTNINEPVVPVSISGSMNRISRDHLRPVPMRSIDPDMFLATDDEYDEVDDD